MCILKFKADTTNMTQSDAAKIVDLISCDPVPSLVFTNVDGEGVV